MAFRVKRTFEADHISSQVHIQLNICYPKPIAYMHFYLSVIILDCHQCCFVCPSHQWLSVDCLSITLFFDYYLNFWIFLTFFQYYFCPNKCFVRKLLPAESFCQTNCYTKHARCNLAGLKMCQKYCELLRIFAWKLNGS